MDETPSTLTTRSVLGTTDAMRKSGVNEEWTPDGKTGGMTDEKTDGTTNGMIVRTLLQETTATTDVDMTIGIGAIMMAIDDVVMTRMLAHATVVAQPRPQTDKGGHQCLTDDEIDGIKAYVPRLRIARWPKGFKPVPIKKYDGQTNPREWLQLYSTAIRSAGGESALDDIRGKGKEKRSDKPESSKKDKKRKPDNAVNTVDRFRKNPRIY
ncbi:hypothetical protein PR202_gb20427 [Eleusine coracana subsp. coracana]|uniref:Uncharacterized protein n=1 Tax=Eleusine coracana subsp. coracana TaxID=191504 RepID=A0AAV5F8I2_ELECO|nr:hypothetical protein PR202_gb20427 [Eleusine coracana subsp. coracana]